ncbi:hypothetical protein OG963_15270 [Streptomyces sp. NBC_01707]|uniref:hypothetical protein n=1 Tax=Streptomyces sp. NBC_01707 TaxID=2975914 RepID=UPI00352CEB15
MNRSLDVRETIPRHKFRATPEAETRVLLLIDGFSHKPRGIGRCLEGRVKLAKLDFLLRYPKHLSRVLEKLGVEIQRPELLDTDAPLDSRMMRYKYGPWDPSYYAVLGSLIGRGLVRVEPLESANGLGYSTTAIGADLSESLRDDESFYVIDSRIKLLRRHLDKSGSTLKKYLYELPEVADSTWHEELT